MRAGWGAAAVALAVAGCAQPVPPLLSLGNRACDARHGFEGAIPVTPDRFVGAEAKLGAASRCIVPAGSAVGTPYAAFQLPGLPGPTTVNIISMAQNGALVSPRATFYDADQKPVRVLGPDDFRQGIAGLRAGVRLQGNERWLVTEADRTMLGQPVVLRLGSRQPGTVQVAYSAPVIIYVPANIPEPMRENKAIYALNGTIQVSANPVPTVP